MQRRSKGWGMRGWRRNRTGSVLLLCNSALSRRSAACWWCKGCCRRNRTGRGLLLCNSLPLRVEAPRVGSACCDMRHIRWKGCCRRNGTGSVLQLRLHRSHSSTPSTRDQPPLDVCAAEGEVRGGQLPQNRKLVVITVSPPLNAVQLVIHHTRSLHRIPIPSAAATPAAGRGR